MLQPASLQVFPHQQATVLQAATLKLFHNPQATVLQEMNLKVFLHLCQAFLKANLLS